MAGLAITVPGWKVKQFSKDSMPRNELRLAEEGRAEMRQVSHEARKDAMCSFMAALDLTCIEDLDGHVLGLSLARNARTPAISYLQNWP